mmetsp:Transcript_27315/g.38639  ORF Transcript_27315/g.38639 Transcript_27315/m.38639 type:complete len:140 (+) Transcript_27315:42-461(+)|eukprot:CAMPEP_0175104162 /NCGR_PEP_ID=MMETSP0086_2-20121207/9542_1 /TAXON_ID=136419 /ORGANISM="Unknown Unknown, Strain D1" /LENGTH=139 /DNA_ID=CAMNT_0016379459 /DNA_START=42 /DNA_END=461 /DNA_ORIENTATION=+
MEGKTIFPAGTANKIDVFADTSQLKGAGDFHKTAHGALAAEAVDQSARDLALSLGMGIKNTYTRHTDGTGVMVSHVNRGTPCAVAGLQEYDIITAVGGFTCTGVSEFGTLLSKALESGPAEIRLNRDGRRNVVLSLSSK